MAARAASEPVDHLLGGVLAADEGLVGPDVRPVAIAAAVGEADLVEVAVHGRECLGTLEVEDDVGVRDVHGVREEDRVLLAQDAAAEEAVDDRLDALLGTPVQRPVLRRVVALRLQAAAAIARYDGGWAKTWAPFLNLLVADAANADRRDKRFPFLRYMDPYAGHGWANGPSQYHDGNNEEPANTP